MKSFIGITMKPTYKFTMIAKEVSSGRIEIGYSTCPTGNCPAVLTTADGRAIVVGRRLNPAELSELELSGLVKVYDHEFAIEVNPELLKAASTKL